MTKKKRKKQNSSNKDSIFFAYQSIEKSMTCDNVDAIQNLAKYLGSKAVTWEKMKTNGKLINRQILLEIDRAETFSCDLTYLNPNVFFELGYAIGKRKPLFIMINTKVKDAVSNYSNICILKGIGYASFNNADDLKRKLNNIDKNYILLDHFNLSKETSNTIDIFYIKSSANSQAEMDTITFIKDSMYTQICDDKSEISYQPLEWYLESINKCKYLIIHLASIDKVSPIDNCVNSLYAGLGYALDKKILLLAPKPYYAPIDYNDILIEYISAQDCVNKIESWLPKKKKVKIPSIKEEKELNLLKLGIGYSIAEDEKNALLNYFVKTYSYTKAFNSRNSIFFGRKGTGKTAMYIKLYDDFGQKDNTYVIGLKPESIELLEYIQAVKLYSDLASKKNLFHSIWKYVLYSKLLIELFEKTVAKNRYEYFNIEKKIIEFYSSNKEKLELNFIGTIRILFDESEHKNQSISKVLEDYNKTFLLPIIDIIKEYFHSTKYYKIVVLADNLDKAWDADADLSLQAEMILSLLEIAGKIEHELFDKKNKTIETTVIMFLRTDIHEFVLSCSREPDKLTVISNEVEWISCRELLKQVVEKRISHVLELGDRDNMQEIWKEYFDFGREDPFELVQKACLPRPRDIIFFFGKMFESACNHSRDKVNKTDFEYALDSYANYLYQNLFAEMGAEYPYIRTMLGELHSKFNEKIEINKFRKIVTTYEKDSKKSKQLLSELFSNEYLIAVSSNHNERYTKLEDIIAAEKIMKLNGHKLLKKKYIYVIQHPRYARITS